MKASPVNIDFKKVEKTFREYVRQKAIDAGSTIVYIKDGFLIEEDPKTSKKNILEEIVKIKFA